MRIKTIISLMSVIALALAACSSGAEVEEQLIESQEGTGDVEIDIGGDGQISVEGEDGEGSFSIGGGEVPDGFPIEVMGGGEVQAVVDTEDGTSVSVRYEDDYDSVRSFYEEWAESNGEIVNTMEISDPQSVTWQVEDGDRTYSISLGDIGAMGVQVTLASTNNP